MTAVGSEALPNWAELLRPGDRIVWGQACGEPTTLVEALLNQAPAIEGLSAFAATSFSGLLDAAAADRLELSSMGAMGALRGLAAAGRLSIIPCQVSQVGALIAQGLIGCDVALVQVSPANSEGQHSYGLINDFVDVAVDRARVVIAEINEQVPFTHGDVALAASRIDSAITVARTPVEVRPPQIGDIDRRIARNAANFIGDGAVIQLGIGAVPDALLHLLRDRRHLGIHSGMVGDALVDLVEAGVVTNASKTVDRGVSVTTALIGSRRLYDFAHRNPELAVRSSAYTHNTAVLSQLQGLVTVNSALEVDLTGQVNAEQSGCNYVGGTGGQLDFVRAGCRSPGGRSIIALPATAKRGGVSRITASLSGPVTTSRSEVDVVVTEYGSAELRGQSLAERSRRLVAIAHPDFRGELDRAAHEIRKRGF